MQKAVLVLFLTFLVFGITLHSPLIFADEDDNSSGNNSEDNSTDNNSNGSNSEDDDRDENETEDDEDETELENETDDDDNDKNRERVRETTTEGNCTIKTETKIIVENGKRIESVKKRIECADGTRTDIKIRIENRTVNGEIREKIRYEIRSKIIDVEAEDGIDLEEETNGTEYKLKARLRNGNITDIKIMPDEASEIALERLRALNFTVELREGTDRERNIPRVVYNIQTNKHGRFLGVFKLALKVEGEVDPETGEFLGTSKPWWAFLVSGEDDDQTDEDDEDETGGNETDTNETEATPILVNLIEENNSSEFGTATLVENNSQVTVTIGLISFPENVSQPAHIHNGSCPDVGTVSYPLTNVLNGESITVLNVTLDQLEDELPLAINVHQSAENATVYVSCGNIEL